jgi:hypothetical protein
LSEQLSPADLQKLLKKYFSVTLKILIQEEAVMIQKTSSSQAKPSLRPRMGSGTNSSPAEVPGNWNHTTETGPEGAVVFEWSNEKVGTMMVGEIMEKKAKGKK